LNDSIWTKRDISEYFGVHRNTIDGWRRKGVLPEPHYQLGGRSFWDKDKLLEQLEWKPKSQ